MPAMPRSARRLGDAVVEAAFAGKGEMRSVVIHDIILR